MNLVAKTSLSLVPKECDVQNLEEKHRYIDTLADFIECNGRFPSRDELTEPE